MKSTRTSKRPLVPTALLALSIAAGAIALGSAPAYAEGGGTPPAEQGLSDPGAQRSQAMNSPGVYPNPGVAHQQQPRGQSANRGAYNGNRNTHNSRPQQYHGTNRSYNYNYNYNNGYHDRSYAYVDPGYRGYYYAPPYYGPPPVVYDPYPSPGISLFFNF